MMREKGNARDAAAVGLARGVSISEQMPAPFFTFDVRCVGPLEADRAAYRALKQRIREATLARVNIASLRSMLLDLAAFPMEEKWAEQMRNTVMTAGKNDLLDKYFAGSGYTAAWYVGVISSASYSAIAAADTMSSHAGWLEANATNAPNYDEATRPALTFSAASGGSKATSAASVFTIAATGTLKGAFVTSNNTKGGTTGILYSAALFGTGDRAVVDNDVVNVTGSWSV